MYNLTIIDDERFELETFSKCLDWENYGFRLVSTFDNGEDAIEYIKTHHVDLILSDIKLNGISGIDIVKFCSNNLPGTYVVLISGYRNFSYAKEAIKYGAKDYLTKPINCNELISTLKNIASVLDKTSHGDSFSNSDNLIDKAMKYIYKNYSKKITSDDVANHISLSPAYFRAYFKQHTGENFSDYLCHYRMNIAKQLLLEGNMSISAICEKVGYKNRTHFYSIFQDHFGCSPKELKNNIAKGNK